MGLGKAAKKKTAEVQKMRDSQAPIRHLQYAEFEIGSYAMVASLPKQLLRSWVDQSEKAVTAKLQPRYSGPYLIVGQISPVVYTLKMDGTDKNIHAVNMKPFKGSLIYTTPYVERGYNKAEADKLIAPQPLLLSPDKTINEAARIRYKKKDTGLIREAT